MLDILISGGQVYDGTGSPPLDVDVGILGDKIVLLELTSSVNAQYQIKHRYSRASGENADQYNILDQQSLKEIIESSNFFLNLCQFCQFNSFNIVDIVLECQDLLTFLRAIGLSLDENKMLDEFNDKAWTISSGSTILCSGSKHSLSHIFTEYQNVRQALKNKKRNLSKGEKQGQILNIN